MGNQTSSNLDNKLDRDFQPKEVIIKSPLLTNSLNPSPQVSPSDLLFSKNNKTVSIGALSIESTSTNSNKEISEQKVAITFTWKEGGTNVYLSGSFGNWNQIFAMNKINNIFEITLVYFT